MTLPATDHDVMRQACVRIGVALIELGQAAGPFDRRQARHLRNQLRNALRPEAQRARRARDFARRRARKQTTEGGG